MSHLVRQDLGEVPIKLSSLGEELDMTEKAVGEL